MTRIEATRDQMGDTVDAIASKADVSSRVKESITDKRDRGDVADIERTSEMKDAAQEKANDLKETTQTQTRQPASTA